jgi:hypothetical protein
MRTWPAGVDLGLELFDEVTTIENEGPAASSDAAAGAGFGEVALCPCRCRRSMTLRWLSTTSPPAESCTSCSLIGIPSKAHRSSLAGGSLAPPTWEPIERACFSAISGHGDALEAQLAFLAGAARPSSQGSHAAPVVLAVVESAIVKRDDLE